MPSPPVVFLDFDGTITTQDATDAILEAFAHPQWRRIEAAWKAGGIGSRECLSSQMALVDASQGDVDALLNRIDVDPGFGEVLKVCGAHAVPVHILSDGFDYCIGRILARSSLDIEPYLRNTRIMSSHLEPDGMKWRASFMIHTPECTHGCATCKPWAMKQLAGAGLPTVFVGDGLSDRYAAAAADVVFAKDALAAFCREQAIAYHPYQCLTMVADRLGMLFASACVQQPLWERRFQSHE